MKKLFNVLEKNSLSLSIALLCLFFFCFYPKTYVSVDEHDYLYNSYNILKGSLKQDCSLKEPSFFQVKEYCIYKYNIGTSFFFIPFIAVNKNLTFLATFSMFILSVVIFDKLLKLNKTNPIFTWFYAFYPSFIYFSRTLFSEIYSLTLLLSLLYLLEVTNKKKYSLFEILIGIIGGASIAVRYTNIIPVFILLFGHYTLKTILLLKNRQGNQFKALFFSFAKILLGLLTVLTPLLLLNKNLYGSYFRSGYFYSGEEKSFFINNIPFMIFRYLSILVILYPGMIILSFFSKNKYKWIYLFCCSVLIIFYSSFSGNRNVFEGRILDLILGARFFVPILPILLLLYFNFLNNYLKTKYFKRIAIIIIVILVFGAFLISYIHQSFLLHFSKT